MNYIFVGCDSHDKTLVNRIALNREAAERKGFAATRSGRRRMIEYLKERSQMAGGAKVAVAYEASGNGFILCDELKESGFECHVLAPTKIERSAKQKRNKNDDRDADRLLDIVRSHYLAGTKLPSEPLEIASSVPVGHTSRSPRLSATACEDSWEIRLTS